jgi:hypothetical protein
VPVDEQDLPGSDLIADVHAQSGPYAGVVLAAHRY